MRSTLTAASSHGLGHCGREPGEHELCEQFGCEAVRYHERLLADAARGADEHFEGTALFPTETTHWSAVWYVRDATKMIRIKNDSTLAIGTGRVVVGHAASIRFIEASGPAGP